MTKTTADDARARHSGARPSRAHPGTPATAAAQGRSGFAVLIVENNPAFREFLQRALRARFPCLTLSTARSVQEALLNIDAARPGLVFTDVHFPDGHGFELTRRIRHMAVDAKVVFLSGYDLPEYRVEAYRSGADRYLTKGTVTTDEILALVESVVSSGDAPGQRSVNT